MWDSRAEVETAPPSVTTAGAVIAQNDGLAHGAAWVGNDSSQSEIWTASLRHGRLGRTVNVGPQRVIPTLPDRTSVQLPRRPPQRVSAGAQLHFFLVDNNRLFRHSHSQPPPAAA